MYPTRGRGAETTTVSTTRAPASVSEACVRISRVQPGAAFTRLTYELTEVSRDSRGEPDRVQERAQLRPVDDLPLHPWSLVVRPLRGALGALDVRVQAVMQIELRQEIDGLGGWHADGRLEIEGSGRHRISMAPATTETTNCVAGRPIALRTGSAASAHPGEQGVQERGTDATISAVPNARARRPGAGCRR